MNWTAIGALAAIAGAFVAFLAYLHSKKSGNHTQDIVKKLLKDKSREAINQRLRGFIKSRKKGESSSEQTLYNLIKEFQKEYPEEIQNGTDALEILNTLDHYMRTERALIRGEHRRRLKEGIGDLRAKIESGDPDRSFENSSSPDEPHLPNPYRNIIIRGLLRITLATTVIWTLILRLLLQLEPGAWFLTTLQQRVSEEPAEAFEIFLAMWLLLSSLSIYALLFAPIRRRLFHWGTQPNAPESSGGDPSVDSIPAPGGTDSEK